MSYHPESRKREASIRIGKIPPALHRIVVEHKQRHHHDTLWSALLDLAEHGANVTQLELQVLEIVVQKHLQITTSGL
jgi:hypothetical protein